MATPTAPRPSRAANAAASREGRRYNLRPRSGHAWDSQSDHVAISEPPFRATRGRRRLVAAAQPRQRWSRIDPASGSRVVCTLTSGSRRRVKRMVCWREAGSRRPSTTARERGGARAPRRPAFGRLPGGAVDFFRRRGTQRAAGGRAGDPLGGGAGAGRRCRGIVLCTNTITSRGRLTERSTCRRTSPTHRAAATTRASTVGLLAPIHDGEGFSSGGCATPSLEGLARARENAHRTK